MGREGIHPGAGVAHRFTGLQMQIGLRDEAVDHAFNAPVLTVDARSAQAIRVGPAFVAQWVALGGHDKCLRQPAKIFRSQRERVCRGLVCAEVLIDEPAHGVAREEVALGKLKV